MESKDLESDDYLIAEGLEGLKEVLDTLLTQSQQDPKFAANPHYILYQIGNQTSLIKVDTSNKPFKFWYADLLGRPATVGIKETIARFLWDKGGAKELYLQE